MSEVLQRFITTQDDEEVINTFIETQSPNYLLEVHSDGDNVILKSMFIYSIGGWVDQPKTVGVYNIYNYPNVKELVATMQKDIDNYIASNVDI